MKTLIICAVLSFTLASCTVDPDEIDYGSDQCHYCRMGIVDDQHAAQYVSLKGKQFKFDAIECMVTQLQTVDESDLAMILVSDYERPGQMIRAKDATFLISKEIKSPMGANLSAFSSEQKANEMRKMHAGATFDWEELKEKFLE